MDESIIGFWEWIGKNAIRMGRKAVISKGPHEGRTVRLYEADAPMIRAKDISTGEYIGMFRPDELSLLPIDAGRIPFSIEDEEELKKLEGKSLRNSKESVDAWTYRYSWNTPPLKVLEYLGIRDGKAYFRFNIKKKQVQGIMPGALYACYDFLEPVDGSVLIGRRS